MKTSLRILLIFFLVGTLVFSLVVAREKIERDFLNVLFSQEYISTLEAYQERYTPAQLIDMKIHGRLPVLPVERKPTELVTDAIIVEEQQSPNNLLLEEQNILSSESLSEQTPLPSVAE